MRDPKRIDEFCSLLKSCWKTVPDWRFGQLFCNVFAASKIDPFFIEDDKAKEMFKEFFKGVY